MRIHHLNCISTCPLGAMLMDGRSASLRGRRACHCMLVETADCLVLVDTGFGLEDVRHPRERLSGFFLALLAPISARSSRQSGRSGNWASIRWTCGTSC